MKKNHWWAIVTSVFLAGAPVMEAEAKRLGSGGNIGRTAPSSPASPSVPGKPAQPQAAPQQPGQQAGAPAAASTAAAAAKPATRSWMGPLAGIAAGLGLAALASYLGFGEELMSLMLIMLAVLAVVVLWRVLAARRRAPEGAYGQPAMARSGYGGNELGAEARPGSVSWPASAGAAGGAGGAATMASVASAVHQPQVADISPQEIEVFVKAAREQFTRLQKIWDTGDIHALAEFCTPEMTRELSHQIADRRGASNETQVVSLEAEWLGMSEGRDDFGKPVDEVQIRFSGLIRESAEAAAADFDEVWTLQRVKGGDSGWVLAGIAQISG